MSDSTLMQRPKTSAELRKINKPLVEKRRRGRINNCLDTLKTLILDATKKDTIRYSKLEKADVLEMTVKHLRDISRGSSANDPQTATINKFRAGFNECATEVTRFLARDDSLTPEMRMSLLNHLGGRLQNVNSLVDAAGSQQMQMQQTLRHHHHIAAATPQQQFQPYPLIPTATPLASLPGLPNLNIATSIPSTMLIPTQMLATQGHMAYVVPTSSIGSASTQMRMHEQPPKYASTPIFPKRHQSSTYESSSSSFSQLETPRRKSFEMSSSLGGSGRYSRQSYSTESFGTPAAAFCSTTESSFGTASMNRTAEDSGFMTKSVSDFSTPSSASFSTPSTSRFGNTASAAMGSSSTSFSNTHEPMQISIKSDNAATDSFAYSTAAPVKHELFSDMDSESDDDELDVTSGSEFPSSNFLNSPLSSPALDINGNGHNVANRNTMNMSSHLPVNARYSMTESNTTSSPTQPDSTSCTEVSPHCSVTSPTSTTTSNAAHTNAANTNTTHTTHTDSTNTSATHTTKNNTATTSCSSPMNQNLNHLQNNATNNQAHNDNQNASHDDDDEDVWRPW